MSRIIIKNLPKNVAEKDLRKHFQEKGNITDIKLVRNNGAFRGFAFMGFELPEQAETAANYFNKSFFNMNKINVQVAKDLSDKSRPKAWHQVKDEQKQVEQKRADEKRLRLQLSHLRTAGNDLFKRNTLLAKYKDDPKFQQYLQLTTGKTDILEISQKDNKEHSENRLDPENNYDIKDHDDNDKDESMEEDEDNIAKKKDISDHAYWQSLAKPSEDDLMERDDKSSKETSAKKKKEWKELHTVRLRIERFPKKGARGCNADGKKNKKGLTKQDIKVFFSPLQCQSIRMNNKNRFEFFIGFASEKIAKQAMRKDRSFILGVRVKVHSLTTSSTDSITQGKRAAPWAEAVARLEQTEPVAESGKLFVRNLSYFVTEEKLRQKFGEHGEIVDLDLPVCKQTRKIKGFCTVTFLYPHCAVAAMNALDGTELQGRLMHILPALGDEQLQEQKSWLSSFKQEKEKEQKLLAGSWHNWNTLFVSSAAVADIMAKKYGKTKEQILNNEGPQSAAVTLALGETQIVNEMRRFLEDNGVSVDAFSDPSVERSDTVLLVKDLPAGTKASDMAELFGKWGELGRVVMPPSGLTCIVEFLSSSEARKAMRNMHYKRFGHTPLYLEKAPIKTFQEEYKKPVQEENVELQEGEEEAGEKRKISTEEEMENTKESPPKKAKMSIAEPELHTTVYVQNLPRDSTEEQITEHFSRAGSVHAVILARNGDQSRGYGFVQYLRQRDAREALVSLEGSTLGGRNLSLKLSEKRLTASIKSARQMHDYGEQKSAKISVKNVPFQATKKELEQIFRPFGTLQRVFLQKHHTGQYNNGGYGFVEYVTLEDAKRALDTLGLSTHFQGRRLVLQWAKEDESVEELRQKTAQKHQFAESLGMGNKKMRHLMREVGTDKSNSE